MGQPIDTDMPKVIETNSDRSVALIKSRVDIHPQARETACSTVVAARLDSAANSLLCNRQLASQKFAFGPVQLQRKDQLAPVLPAILRQQCCTGIEIGERRGVGSGPLGALAGDQV